MVLRCGVPALQSIEKRRVARWTEPATPAGFPQDETLEWPFPKWNDEARVLRPIKVDTNNR
jgi:hypothetical protein